jgi:hypothetical protein
MFILRSGVSYFVCAQAQEVNPLAGQDEHETLEALLRNVDLSFAWNALRGCFHASGVDRLQRNRLGVFSTSHQPASTHNEGTRERATMVVPFSEKSFLPYAE